MRITHPFYGSIEFNGVHELLINTPEMARLRHIKQLAFVYLAFPGAMHSRFTHSLGVAHLAGKIADHLGVDETEKKAVQCAALLHDIGHTPFSHSLDGLRQDGKSHEQFAFDIVLGDDTHSTIPGAGDIPKILRNAGISDEAIAELIIGDFEKRYLQQMISGPIDADRLDYLVADAYYTGCKHGVVDVDRVISCMTIEDRQIRFLPKGLTSVQHVLTARSNMRGDVYLHHTPRIAEAMLKKAVELTLEEIPDFHEYTDAKLTTRLEESENPKARDLINRITYNSGEGTSTHFSRNLYKVAFQIKSDGADENKIKTVKEIAKTPKRELEKYLCEETGSENGDVLVDFPETKPRYDANELKKNGIEFTLEGKKSNYSLFSVYCPAEKVEEVRVVAQRLTRQAYNGSGAADSEY